MTPSIETPITSRRTVAVDINHPEKEAAAGTHNDFNQNKFNILVPFLWIRGNRLCHSPSCSSAIILAIALYLRQLQMGYQLCRLSFCRNQTRATAYDGRPNL